MISEFQDLSDKIDKLAQLTQSLRSENYLLRQANALLSAENVDFKHRLLAAQQRVEALLANLEPAAEPAAGGDEGEAAAESSAESAATNSEDTQ
jgi:cell division protein ZapB